MEIPLSSYPPRPAGLARDHARFAGGAVGYRPGVDPGTTGDDLRRRRIALGLTKTALVAMARTISASCGIATLHVVSISRVESGEYGLGSATHRALCEALDAAEAFR